MAKIDQPKPLSIQQMEEREMAEMHKALVGAPVRIEIPLDSPIIAREAIRQVRALLERCDYILSDHIQNPPPTTGKDRRLDWMVLHEVKSIVRMAQKMLPTRKTSKGGK